ncbi:hypothetical protein DFS34DRAFT_650793 [Phlyctochytrium arcticum]|nr:hypothetical protein DFS34DRAFT_650793 [Phlyctochytrium arcticum]
MVLRKMMEEVFLSYIQRVDFAGLDVMNGLSGINYASMNRQSFLKVATFINRLKSDFPLLKYGCLLWHDQLVWSSTRSPSDLQDVYDYFTDPETGRVYDGLINQVKRKGEPVTHGRRASLRAPAPRSATSRKGRRFTGYLVGPPQLNTVSTDTTLKEVYIGDDGDPYFLIVYQFEDDTTFIFLIPTSAIVQPLQSDNQLLLPLEQNPRRIEFYVKLADHLNKNLAEIAQVVQAGWTNARQVGDFAEQHFRYLYFNSSTLSFKSSISRHKTTQLTPDLIHCLNNMHEDFLSMSADGELTELNLQTTLSDAWVVGRRNNSREFYMVFPKSEASVVDIDDDVEKFSTAYLQETRS